EGDHLRPAGKYLRSDRPPDVEDMPDAEEGDHPTGPKSRASLTLCTEQTVAFALHRRLPFTSVIQREIRSRTTRPYIRTISSARTSRARTRSAGLGSASARA